MPFDFRKMRAADKTTAGHPGANHAARVDGAIATPAAKAKRAFTATIEMRKAAKIEAARGN